MKKIFMLGSILCTLSYTLLVSANEESKWEKELNIPSWVKVEFSKSALLNEYYFYFKHNPVYLRGNFDSDSHADVAVMVENKTSKKTGIIVIHHKNKKAYLLGAGKDIGNGGDDFSWLTNWSVKRNSDIGKGATQEKPPQIKGEAIFVEKAASASAILYWTGVSYLWYQQGG